MSNMPKAVVKLSHKAFRALLKKFRRKKKRQLLARSREKLEQLEQEKKKKNSKFQIDEEEMRRNAELFEQFEEHERIQRHKEWLVREELAQAEFRRKKLLQEQEQARKEEERKKMLAELEEKNMLEVPREKSEKNRKEEALQEALSGLPEGSEPWHNPIAPENYSAGSQREQCLFFAKTGCCRFGERCSRGHLYPDVSCTILIKGMYTHFSIEQRDRDDYDTDMALEFEEGETYSDFKEFYEDVLPEFKKCGTVVQFKVCNNHEPHLRGNVYVQYSREEEAIEAFKQFNGRFYAGKQLSCEFTNVIKWKSAICGLYASNRCPKGNNCNFLHVFRNPNNEFWSADRDLPPYRENGRHSSRRESERHGSRELGSSRRSERHYSPHYSERRHRHYPREHGRSSDSRERRKIHSRYRKRTHSPESDGCDSSGDGHRYDHYERNVAESNSSLGSRGEAKHHQRSRSRSVASSASSHSSCSDGESSHTRKSKKKKKKSHKKTKKSKKKKKKRSSSSSGRE